MFFQLFTCISYAKLHKPHKPHKPQPLDHTFSKPDKLKTRLHKTELDKFSKPHGTQKPNHIIFKIAHAYLMAGFLTLKLPLDTYKLLTVAPRFAPHEFTIRRKNLHSPKMKKRKEKL